MIYSVKAKKMPRLFSINFSLSPSRPKASWNPGNMIWLRVTIPIAPNPSETIVIPIWVTE